MLHNVQEKSNSSWGHEWWAFDQLHQTFQHTLRDASHGASRGARVTLRYIPTVEKN